MPTTHTVKKHKKKQARLSKGKIEPIPASPERIAQALVHAAERKAQERRKELA